MIYLVVGIDESNGKRFASHVMAGDPALAERHVNLEHPDVKVAAVITGENVEVVA